MDISGGLFLFVVRGIQVVKASMTSSPTCYNFHINNCKNESYPYPRMTEDDWLQAEQAFDQCAIMVADTA
jgi:hypothetical protein